MSENEAQDVSAEASAAAIGKGTVGLAGGELDGSRPVARGPVLARLMVVLAGVLVGLIVVDQGVVAWDADQEGDDEVRPIIPHEQIGWVNRPHFENPQLETVLDRFGLRNPEIPEDAPLDEVRIMGFGASRTYGAGGALQPWCWNYELERLLVSRGVRVLNGGVSGYSTLQACRRAAAMLDALEPDLIFVVASTGAQMMLDPSSARNWVRFGEDADQLVPADVVEDWPDFVVPMVARVHRMLAANSGIYRRHRAKFQANGDRVGEVQRWVVSRAERSEVADEMLNATLDEAQALGAMCAERGIELRMLVLPEIAQDSDAAWRQFLRRNQSSGAPPLDTPRDEPTNVLAERLRQNVTLGRLVERRSASPRTRPFGENPFPIPGT